MIWPEDFINKIICRDNLSVMKKMPDECIDMVITSPPYWGLRDYGFEQIFGGDPDCKHIWATENVYHDNLRFRDPNKIASVGTDKNPKIFTDPKLKQGDCIYCGAWKGQLGLEPTPELYIEHMTEIFNEIKRILKKEGTFWLNMGDTYSTHTSKRSGQFGKDIKEGFDDIYSRKRILPLQEKCLCMIPERLSWSLIQDGWILRNKIIWHKKNHMPSSAKDRFTNTWEYIFLFSKSNKPVYWTNEKTLKLVIKQPLGINGKEDEDWKWKECPNCEGRGEIIKENVGRKCSRCKGAGKIKINFWATHDYYFDLDSTREPYTEPLNRWGGPKIDIPKKTKWKSDDEKAKWAMSVRERQSRPNLKGKNPGDAWIINTQPFPEAHFAVFPEKLCERPIKAGCPEQICKKCGKVRVRIIELGKVVQTFGSDKGKTAKSDHYGDDTGNRKRIFAKKMIARQHETIGWTACNCKADFEGGIVLDPFCGVGTALYVAKEIRRRYIGIDIKEEYCELAEKRMAQGVL